MLVTQTEYVAISNTAMLRNFTPRLYQQTILGSAAHKNTLVVLPTGMGKTGVAVLLTAQRLHQYPNAKILLLSPTKPLCEQHVETFRAHVELPPERVVLFTGSVSPEKRGELWKDATIIISTPQGLENDVINKRVKLEDVSLLIFDEAHHATGDYAYVWLAQQYENVCSFPRILALTASPGSDLEHVREVCQNLKIERVEVRTEDDPDVKPYVQEVAFHWIKVDFPEEFKNVQKYLKECLHTKQLELQKHGYTQSASLTKGELLLLQGELQKEISSGIRDFELLRSISLVAEALKVEHALELLETQGLTQADAYIRKLQQESLTSKVKAVQNLVQDANFKAAAHLAQELVASNFPHPKLVKLTEIVQQQYEQNKALRMIVFTQFRSSAEQIRKALDESGMKNHIFVGQAKKEGLGFSQKQQKEILDRFRTGEFNVLIATSVAEEGLDIPKVDTVLFYEPIPSAIRSIQRRGRTGRLEKGEVTILVTAGTRDEAYRWSAHHKEKRMYRNLEELKKSVSILHQGQRREKPLSTFIPQEQVVAVLADHREKDNKTVKELLELGISVRTTQLEAADYLVSGKVAVELKKVPDFVASIIDGRLLDQMREIKKSFDKAVLIIEGEEDMYAIRKVHANAIRGMLASIALDFNVSILHSKNPKETAGLLAVMAKREQEKDRDFSYHERKPRSLAEQQEFIVSSFPGVGVQNARKLLQHFGSLQKLVNASSAEMKAVEGIGGKISERLWKLFVEEYGEEKK